MVGVAFQFQLQQKFIPFTIDSVIKGRASRNQPHLSPEAQRLPRCPESPRQCPRRRWRAQARERAPPC